MFIKRAKSRPSLRARETEDEPSITSGSPLAKSVVSADAPDSDISMSIDDVDDQGSNSGSVMERKKARNKEKKGLSKGTRLSFGGEGEEGGSTPFKPKKSLLSQSIKLPSTPTTSDAPAAAVPSTSSIYSRDYLSELKASTPSRAPRVESQEEGDAANGGSGLSQVAQAKYGALLVEDSTAGIPDAAAVASAKAKRLAAVEMKKRGLDGEDYIALGDGQVAVWEGEKGPHPESRLMREEDEGEDGDEDMADYTEANERLFLGKKANKSAARRLKGEMGEMIDDREAEDEDNEETREWEEAQVRRGGTWEAEKPVAKVKPTYAAAPIPIARPLPTISSASARVAKSLADIKASQTQSEHNLDVAVRDLSLLEEQEKDLRREVERVEGKREWVEGFRGWVEQLGGFLEEKVPKLEDIEADAMHHLKERADMSGKRRAADDEDDLALFLGAPASAEEEVDDFGRSRAAEAGPSSAVRRARRSEREERRVKRRARQAKQNDEEGFSTDSTLADGDAQDYASAHRDLGKRVESLLDDVRAEDFRDPEKGLAVRFGDWRKSYSEEYVNAFGGLAMVQAWEFYARGEMVGWEPLRSSTPLESFAWFHSLHSYSRPRPETNGATGDDDMDLDDEPPLGPDGDLVTDMVSKAVLPLLIKSFESGAFDPYSTPQTRKAIDLAEVISDLTGKDSRKYADLLKAIMGVFRNHVADLIVQMAAATGPGAIAPPGFDPNTRIALGRYVRRRLKLVKNLLLWKREAGRDVSEILNRIVGEVLKPVLDKQWDGGGKELAAMVAVAVGTDVRPDLAVFLREGQGPRRW